MPIRKKTILHKRLNGKTLDALRGWIRTGEAWSACGFGNHKVDGSADAKGLVTGFFYDFAMKFCREDDEESKRALWMELRDDILVEHIKYAPTTRPWGWWHFEPEAEEARRTVELRDEDGDPYEAQESECSYLERNDLLTPEERSVLARFGNVVRVRCAAAQNVGNCQPCWTAARRLAADMKFDLDAAIKFHKFWIPASLLFKCDHEERYHGNDCIFDEQ